MALWVAGCRGGQRTSGVSSARKHSEHSRMMTGPVTAQRDIGRRIRSDCCPWSRYVVLSLVLVRFLQCSINNWPECAAVAMKASPVRALTPLDAPGATVVISAATVPFDESQLSTMGSVAALVKRSACRCTCVSSGRVEANPGVRVGQLVG